LFAEMTLADIDFPYLPSRWLRLLFGREFNLLDLLILWDAIFGVGEDLVFTYYIVVAMLIHVRDKRKSKKLRKFRFDFVIWLTLSSAIERLHNLPNSPHEIPAERRRDAHYPPRSLHEVAREVSVPAQCLRLRGE
jgi:hypothetical protein